MREELVVGKRHQEVITQIFSFITYCWFVKGSLEDNTGVTSVDNDLIDDTVVTVTVEWDPAHILLTTGACVIFVVQGAG